MGRVQTFSKPIIDPKKNFEETFFQAVRPIPGLDPDSIEPKSCDLLLSVISLGI